MHTSLHPSSPRHPTPCPAPAASKGLYRVHQFSKVEMFVVCTPEQSEALHQQLLDLEVEMFTQLGLHFKVGWVGGGGVGGGTRNGSGRGVYALLRD